jgi:hypothetical protein
MFRIFELAAARQRKNALFLEISTYKLRGEQDLGRFFVLVVIFWGLL